MNQCAPTESIEFFSKYAKFLNGTSNFWIDELKLPRNFCKTYDFLLKLLDKAYYLMFLLQFLSIFSQKDLNEKQIYNSALFLFLLPTLNFFATNARHHKDTIRQLLQHLVIDLKNIYNDLDVEQDMIKKSKLIGGTFWILYYGIVILYGLDATITAINEGGNFVVVVTAWPDTKDPSKLAGLARVLVYLMYCTLVTRSATAYAIFLTLVSCLRYQFKNLQSYFISLNNIFDREDLDQTEMDEEYEAALKIGIKMHKDSLSCKNEIEKVCRIFFCGQIINNMTLLGIMIAQLLNQDRTLSSETVTIVFGIMLFLFNNGFVMGNAGDVTAEASLLPTSMFFSGWQHCQKKTLVRIRPLLIVAMMHGQTPVEFVCFGTITLSYSSFVSIVKASYSVFSVLF